MVSRPVSRRMPPRDDCALRDDTDALNGAGDPLDQRSACGVRRLCVVFSMRRINASRVARDVGLAGHQAAINRIEELVRAFLAWHCHRAREDRPHTAAPRKLYFVDPIIVRLPPPRETRSSPPRTPRSSPSSRSGSPSPAPYR